MISHLVEPIVHNFKKITIPLIIGIGNEDKPTKQKFDGTVGTNYVGPFLLTYLLLERIKKSGGGRIINVSSSANYM